MNSNPSQRNNAFLENGAIGKGIANIADSGEVLDVWFYSLDISSPKNTSEVNKLDSVSLSPEILAQIKYDEVRQVKTQAVEVVVADLGRPIENAFDAYLRLHLLSHRLVKPNTIQLNNIFSVLANVVWTNQGPCSVKNFHSIQIQLKTRANLVVLGIDKFPRMVDYHIPTGVRIANGDRVRLGAYLSSGTTVMHEGFVNYNAGTLGASMIEGRISAGVIVGEGSDIGGGASIMGTLSGGGKEKITVGRHTLLGANSGLGISLGDNCIVEAGLYLTAGTKVKQIDGTYKTARELSNSNDLVFRRNSKSGSVEAIPRATSQQIDLNQDLHKND